MTETQPQQTEEEFINQIIDLIHAQTQDGGHRYIITLSLACDLIHKCLPLTSVFKTMLRRMKKTLPEEEFQNMKFLMDVCNRFKQAEKMFEKNKKIKENHEELQRRANVSS